MKHSVPALASFWIALAGILLPLVVVAVLFTASADGNGTDDLFRFTLQLTRIASFAWLVFTVEVVALTLGIVALLGQGRKVLAWIGATVSAVPVIGFLAVVVSAQSESVDQFTENWIGSLNETVSPPDSIEFLTRWTGEGFSFHREDTREDSVGELVVPVNRPIKLSLEGEVSVEMHIPAFRISRTILAGRFQSVWFEATTVGSYEVLVRRQLPDGELEPAGLVRVVER